MYSRSRQAGGGTASNVAPVAGVSPARSRSVGPPSAPVPPARTTRRYRPAGSHGRISMAPSPCVVHTTRSCGTVASEGTSSSARTTRAVQAAARCKLWYSGTVNVPQSVPAPAWILPQPTTAPRGPG